MREEYDFSNAKRASEVPHLAKLQEEAKGKSRITIMLDNDVLVSFREKAAKECIGYQTLINQTLRTALRSSQPVDETLLRKVLREELHSH